MVQSDPLLKLKAKSAPSHQQSDVCKVLMKSTLAGHNITVWNMPGTFWNSCLRAPPDLYRRCWKRCAGNRARGARLCLSLPKRPDLQSAVGAMHAHKHRLWRAQPGCPHYSHVKPA